MRCEAVKVLLGAWGCIYMEGVGVRGGRSMVQVLVLACVNCL